MTYNFDELVQDLDERLDHFAKMLELHREIVWQNEQKFEEWKEG